MLEINYEKHSRINKQALIRVCGYLDERVGCPKENKIFTC